MNWILTLNVIFLLLHDGIVLEMIWTSWKQEIFFNLIYLRVYTSTITVFIALLLTQTLVIVIFQPKIAEFDKNTLRISNCIYIIVIDVNFEGVVWHDGKEIPLSCVCFIDKHEEKSVILHLCEVTQYDPWKSRKQWCQDATWCGSNIV